MHYQQHDQQQQQQQQQHDQKHKYQGIDVRTPEYLQATRGGKQQATIQANRFNKKFTDPANNLYQNLPTPQKRQLTRAFNKASNQVHNDIQEYLKKHQQNQQR